MMNSSEFGNENMIQAFKYRIYPAREQESKLEIDRDINAAINIYIFGRREINACGDETAMVEKATVSHVKEAGNLETASNCQFREYR